uniref:Phospholipase D3-like n=1 Tax=Hirondellea gigas TaxID=1518452 RepID=A0A2P2I4Q2_9CRUS
MTGSKPPSVADIDPELLQPVKGKGCLATCQSSKGMTYLFLGAAAIVIAFLTAIIVVTLLNNPEDCSAPTDCSTVCRFELVESMPDNLTYPDNTPAFKSTYDAWSELLSEAQEKVDLAVFYWSLTSSDVKPGSHFPSASDGAAILQQLKDTGLKEGVKMRIAQNAATSSSPQLNSAMLSKAGAAEVRNVDIQRLVGGVLHTKLWLVDDDKMYIGSANMDFRSLTQVKELGVLISNCSCLVQDMRKIFEEYWSVGGSGRIPAAWPEQFSTKINLQNPLSISLNGITASSLVSSSPPPFTSHGRTDDVNAIVAAIADAKKTVDVAVMDYFPRTLYTHRSWFWPDLDNALRSAAVDGVRVRILASHWKHTRKDLVLWLQSLVDITMRYPRINIQAKLFVVPAYTDEQKEIPFSRVNHNKYMVTDRIAYIGTSNWSGDYFINTGGVGLIVNESLSHSSSPPDDLKSSLRTQLQSVFNRDWNSEYARPLFEFLPKKETADEV